MRRWEWIFVMLELKGWGCRTLTDELEKTRNMLQHLQDSLVQDDGQQLKVLFCLSTQ